MPKFFCACIYCPLNALAASFQKTHCTSIHRLRRPLDVHQVLSETPSEDSGSSMLKWDWAETIHTFPLGSSPIPCLEALRYASEGARRAARNDVNYILLDLIWGSYNSHSTQVGDSQAPITEPFLGCGVVRMERATPISQRRSAFALSIASPTVQRQS